MDFGGEPKTAACLAWPRVRVPIGRPHSSALRALAEVACTGQRLERHPGGAARGKMQGLVIRVWWESLSPRDSGRHGICFQGPLSPWRASRQAKERGIQFNESEHTFLTFLQVLTQMSLPGSLGETWRVVPVHIGTYLLKQRPLPSSSRFDLSAFTVGAVWDAGRGTMCNSTPCTECTVCLCRMCRGMFGGGGAGGMYNSLSGWP